MLHRTVVHHSKSPPSPSPRRVFHHKTIRGEPYAPDPDPAPYPTADPVPTAPSPQPKPKRRPTVPVSIQPLPKTTFATMPGGSKTSATATATSNLILPATSNTVTSSTEGPSVAPSVSSTVSSSSGLDGADRSGSSSNKSLTVIIVGAVAGGLLVVFLIAALLIRRRSSKRNKIRRGGNELREAESYQHQRMLRGGTSGEGGAGTEQNNQDGLLAGTTAAAAASAVAAAGLGHDARRSRAGSGSFNGFMPGRSSRTFTRVDEYANYHRQQQLEHDEPQPDWWGKKSPLEYYQQVPPIEELYRTVPEEGNSANPEMGATPVSWHDRQAAYAEIRDREAAPTTTTVASMGRLSGSGLAEIVAARSLVSAVESRSQNQTQPNNRRESIQLHPTSHIDDGHAWHDTHGPGVRHSMNGGDPSFSYQWDRPLSQLQRQQPPAPPVPPLGFYPPTVQPYEQRYRQRQVNTHTQQDRQDHGHPRGQSSFDRRSISPIPPLSPMGSAFVSNGDTERGQSKPRAPSTYYPPPPPIDKALNPYYRPPPPVVYPIPPPSPFKRHQQAPSQPSVGFYDYFDDHDDDEDSLLTPSAQRPVIRAPVLPSTPSAPPSAPASPISPIPPPIPRATRPSSFSTPSMTALRSEQMSTKRERTKGVANPPHRPPPVPSAGSRFSNNGSTESATIIGSGSGSGSWMTIGQAARSKALSPAPSDYSEISGQEKQYTTPSHSFGPRMGGRMPRIKGRSKTSEEPT